MTTLLNYVRAATSYLLPSGTQSNAAILEQRFGNNPAAEAVYNEYFSSYSKNLLPLDDATLNQIEHIVQRKAAGLEISAQWKRITLGDGGWALDSTHREIPNEPLLCKALTAQFIFEKELAQLKRLDAYQALCHSKITPELNLLKREQSGRSWFCLKKPRYTQSEQDLISGIREKADHYGRPLKEQLGHSIQMREALLQDVTAKIAAIRADRFSPAEAVWLDPQSIEMQTLLEDSKRLDPEEVYEPYDLHPSIKDHCVIAIGDPIKDIDAQFMIVKRPEEMPKEAWLQFIAQENTLELSEALKGVEITLNKAFVVHFPHQGKIYPVEICLEKVSDALLLHENRDLYTKTRRKVKESGVFERTNSPEKTDPVSMAKRAWRLITNDDWSEHREATAGVDSHEAILVSRKLLGKILSGNFGQMSQSVAQNLGEYFNALPVADVAGLPGSYMQDHRFLQAERLHGLIYQREKELFQAGKITSFLESGVRTQFDWGKHNLRFDHLTQNVFEIYGAWSQNLEQFLRELDLPINLKVKEAFGDQLVGDLRAFLPVLQAFVNNAPHLDIRPVIAARKVITDAAIGRPLTQAEKDQLANIWTVWKQGKTPEEIDRVLTETSDAIDRGLAALGPNLVRVSVPFSSPRVHVEIGDAINKTNPQLMALYGKAIPPIWQNKARLSLARDEVMRGTELSPLWLKAAEMFSNGESRLLENEFERSRLAKLYIGARNQH